VARCWTYETSIALGVDIANELPYNDYFEYYGPDFKLHISPSNMANQNNSEYLDKIKTKLLENLRMLPHAPGVQMQPIPDDALKNLDEVNEDRENPDQRISIRSRDKALEHPSEYYEDEDESDDRKNQHSYKRATADESKKDSAEHGTKKAKLEGNEAEMDVTEGSAPQEATSGTST